MKRIGYVRVSTKDQNPDRQMDAIKSSQIVTLDGKAGRHRSAGLLWSWD